MVIIFPASAQRNPLYIRVDQIASKVIRGPTPDIEHHGTPVTSNGHAPVLYWSGTTPRVSHFIQSNFEELNGQ